MKQIISDDIRWYEEHQVKVSNLNLHIDGAEEISRLLLPRSRYAHKGTCGHALLVSGIPGIAGCAILAGRACMRGGVGKLTVMTARENIPVLQCAVPEAIVMTPSVLSKQTYIDFISNTFKAVGIGPGIGTDMQSTTLLKDILQATDSPMVIDADALTILAANRELLQLIPEGSILTPHLLELQRLIGTTGNVSERLEKTRRLALTLKINIVVKGAYSAIVLSDGSIHVNTSGNPGMATAGSGDVLTGIILSLLAQGYPSANAIRLGVFLHGLAGDIAAEKGCIFSLIASDIVDNIGFAYNRLISLQKDDKPSLLNDSEPGMNNSPG